MDIILIFSCGVLAMYFLIGFGLNFIIFFWSKMKGMDKIEESWDIYINSLSGFIYFLISGMFFWLPVTIMFLLERQRIKRLSEAETNEEQKNNEDEIDDEGIYTELTIWQSIRHPYRTYQAWFNQYHT